MCDNAKIQLLCEFALFLGVLLTVCYIFVLLCLLGNFLSHAKSFTPEKRVEPDK